MAKLALGAGAALLNAAMAVSSAAGTLIVGARLDVTWAALPATAGIVGTGFGSLSVAALIRRAGHGRGVRAGYAVAVLGSAVCVVATYRHGPGSVALLVGGLFLLGIGNAAAQLSRYVAAERETPSRRATAIAVVVWIATIGAVGGPLLLGASGRLAGAKGLPMDAGPFLFAGLCAAGAVLATSRVSSSRSLSREAAPRVFESAAARDALFAMAAAQVIMVAVMTAAPMNMDMHGATRTSIGAVLSAHTFGMFAFSPLTGTAIARFGPRPVIRAGLAVLLVSAAATTISAGAAQPVALLVLGYGWNLCFIGGSTLLAAHLDVTARLAVEGRVDAMVWGFAASAGLLSTVLLSVGGAALIAAFAAVVGLAPLARLRRSLASA